jgi:hypothetical protein
VIPWRIFGVCVMNSSIQNIAADSIVDVVEGIYYMTDRGGMDISQAMNYIKKSKPYAYRALAMACEFGFAEKKGNRFFANSSSGELAKTKKSERYIIFRKYLQRFKPFIAFQKLVIKGNATLESARKLKIIFSLDLSEKEIRFALLNWGQYAQIFDYDNSSDEIVFNIDLEDMEKLYLKELLESLDTDVRVRICLADKLTEYVYGYLDSDEIEHLVKALMNHERDPRNSIDDAGRALEDFLRRFSSDHEIDVSSFQGITKIAEYIGSKEIGMIHEKQKKILIGIAAIRNLASHSKDRELLSSWEISPEFALEAILITASMIRSLYFYVEKGELTA